MFCWTRILYVGHDERGIEHGAHVHFDYIRAQSYIFYSIFFDIFVLFDNNKEKYNFFFIGGFIYAMR